MTAKLAGGARERLLLDLGWKFHPGDLPVDSGPIPLNETYLATQAGGALGAAAACYDDSGWRDVDLPHDWQVEQPFDRNANASHGFKPRGIGWYRRMFPLAEEDRGRYLAIEFGGVATHCTVWFNGTRVAHNFCGYTPFRVDVSELAWYGDRLNSLAVRVDADAWEAWSYEGAGIYRHVRLIRTDPLHVAQWGTCVQPVRRKPGEWDTPIEVTVENSGHAPRAFEVVSTLYSPDGRPIGEVSTPGQAPARARTVVKQNIPARNLALWDIQSPRTHTLKTRILSEGRVVDDYDTSFGYRTFRFDPNEGFFLNDRPVKIKGLCCHQDHAGVGAAVPDAVHDFRVRRLKEMGANAYRTAHHPPDEALLDACDRHGLLVLDENRNFGSSSDVLRQLRTMVLRDRNRASVFLWSIFNEESFQGASVGRRLAEVMRAEVKKLDPTRPVTAAMCGGILSEQGVGEAVDVLGVNYRVDDYEPYHERHPDTPILNTESCAIRSTRGVYETEPGSKYFASYDDAHTEFGRSGREGWRQAVTRPYVMGYFIWSGFEYRGEPSPHRWPCVHSTYGLLDTCGFAKEEFHLHRALWKAEPIAHLLPHWTWPGREGQEIRVLCFTNGETAELFVNGTSCGEQEVDPFTMPSWQVPYAPGTLRVEARKGGKAFAADTVETAGTPVAVRLTPDRPRLRADGQDALPVAVSAVDAEGRAVPTAAHRVDFELEGPGRIIGVGNGDPTCHEADKGRTRSLFNGLCQVIVQAGSESGVIRLRASAEGLAEAELAVECSACEPPARVPVVKGLLYVGGWRMSPVRESRPDPGEEIPDDDMNTWERIEITGGSQPAFLGHPGYALYKARFRMPAREQGRAEKLVLGGFFGEMEVFLNGERIGGPARGYGEGLEIALPGDIAGENELTLVIRGDGESAGLTKHVWIQPLGGPES